MLPKTPSSLKLQIESFSRSDLSAHSPQEVVEGVFAGKKTKQISGKKPELPIQDEGPAKGVKLGAREAARFEKPEKPKSEKAPIKSAIAERSASYVGQGVKNILSLPKAAVSQLLAPALKAAGNLSYSAFSTFAPPAMEAFMWVMSGGEIPEEHLKKWGEAIQLVISKSYDGVSEGFEWGSDLLDRHVDRIIESAGDNMELATQLFVDKVAPTLIRSAILYFIKSNIDILTERQMSKEQLNATAFCVTSMLYNGGKVTEDMGRKVLKEMLFEKLEGFADADARSVLSILGAESIMGKKISSLDKSGKIRIISEFLSDVVPMDKENRDLMLGYVKQTLGEIGVLTKKED